MSPTRPSTTALFVSALRAIASTQASPLFLDPHAGRFLPRSWARAIDLAGRQPRAGAILRFLPDLISPGRLQHIALRTRVIDDALAREVERGVRQVVLLGAGFDTRAYRLTSLASASVLEVDHPATQQRKRARASDLVPYARAHQFVPVDFERDDLAARLRSSAFDALTPSVFVWEGVLMYLSEAAIHATLQAVARSMAEGSLLVASYYDPSGASGRPSFATTGLAALVGEPFRTRFSPSEAARRLGEHGLCVEVDSGRNDWAREHGVVARGSAQERVLLARRQTI
jgi:methyltransferase (TIGR00027 family)